MNSLGESLQEQLHHRRCNDFVVLPDALANQLWGQLPHPMPTQLYSLLDEQLRGWFWFHLKVMVQNQIRKDIDELSR